MENSRQTALKNLMAADFTAYELQLYLDTHPDDKDAMVKYTEAVKKAAVLRTEYENMYGPISASSAAGKLPWQWTASPWNWE